MTVIKIFTEGGLEASLFCLGTEVDLYNLVHKLNSSLKNYIPSLLASGILLFENGSYRVLPWDGRGVLEVIASSNLVSIKHEEVDYPFGLWAKKKFEYENARRPLHESGNCAKTSLMWPYIVTRRCRGRIFAELRDTLSSEDELNLTSFLGEQLHNLHRLPVPVPYPSCNDSVPFVCEKGDPIPGKLIEKIDEYIPRDLKLLYDILEQETEDFIYFSLIQSDVMDDNIYMTPRHFDSLSEETNSELYIEEGTHIRRSNNNIQKLSWDPGYILDFSNLTAGEPILDLIPIYLDVFRGDSRLLKQVLDSYKLPFVKRKSVAEVVDNIEQCVAVF